MSKESGSGTALVTVLGLLGIAFVVLKLINVINWSWWYVTAPFWWPLGFVLAVITIALLFRIIQFLITGK